ncbi:MAG: ABC transporter ATP-binding protein [bacterium]
MKAIEFKSLNFTYPDGKSALQDIDLTIIPGETVGVIGSNGAGKSTLLLHFNAILRGKSDISKIFDHDIIAQNLTKIRRAVGLVFQDPDNQLFMPKVFDDISFAPINYGLSKDKIEGLVKSCLKAIDLEGFEERISHHLSYGEKKRIAIATVLAQKPQLIALDEPTANMDPKHRRKLIELLGSLKQTKIIASHDLTMIGELCDRIILLYQGKIVADAPKNKILHDKALLEKYDLLP